MNSLLFSKIKIGTKFGILGLFLFLFLGNYSHTFAQKKDFIVVLDAGHGGKDPGKVDHKNGNEKAIALNIVLQAGKLLEKEPGIKVVYTRKTDVFVELKERGHIANKANADLFVSVHCNAHSSQASGAETWVLGTHANKQNFEVAKAENAVILLEDNYEVNYKGFDPNSPESVIGITLMQEEYLDQSILLASIIQKGLSENLNRKDRGVKQAGFVVLHQTYMPSVLIETGFITNKEEGAFLNSATGQKAFATSIYKEILEYYNQLQLNTVATADLGKQYSDVINETFENENKNASSIYKNIVFKVQIAAGSRKLETKSYNFNGLKDVERDKVGGIYKYYIGNTSNYNQVLELQKLAKSKGYKSAFVIAFSNGKKVEIEDVLKNGR